MRRGLPDLAKAFADAVHLRFRETFGAPKNRRLLRWERQRRSIGYDWDNLAHIPVKRPGVTNLQEYWRMPPGGGPLRDPAAMKGDELFEDESGKLWHLVHLPWHQTVKGIGAKAQWKAGDPLFAKLETLVRERLDNASVTDPGEDGAAQIDEYRALLDGASLGNLPQRTDLGAQHLSCKNAYFHDFIAANGWVFGSCAQFDGALFRQGVQFYRAIFSMGAHFRNTIFLENSEFSGARFKARTSFQSADFHEIASFSVPPEERGKSSRSGNFLDGAKFSSVRFRAGADFFKTRFSGKAAFDKARFKGDAQFNNASFEDRAIFSGSRFHKRSQFLKTKFALSARFDRAHFDGAPQFGEAALPTDTSFDDARFDLVFWLGAGARAIFFVLLGIAVALNAVITVAPEDVWWIRLLYVAPALAFLSGCTWFFKQAKLEKLARSLRYLAKASDNLGHKRDAALFLRQEQRALRLRATRNAPGKLMSITYDLISEYGDNISRPLLWLALVTTLFAVGYWRWLDGQFAVHPPPVFYEWHQNQDVLAASEFSARNVVQPFSVLSPPPLTSQSENECTLRARLMGVGSLKSEDGERTSCAEAWIEDLRPEELKRHRLSVQFVASAQSLVSGLLLFLSLLATRRRFSVA